MVVQFRVKGICISDESCFIVTRPLKCASAKRTLIDMWGDEIQTTATLPA